MQVISSEPGTVRARQDFRRTAFRSVSLIKRVHGRGEPSRVEPREQISRPYGVEPGAGGFSLLGKGDESGDGSANDYLQTAILLGRERLPDLAAL